MTDRQKERIEHQVGSMLERLSRGNDYTRELVEHSKEQIRRSLKLLKRSEDPKDE
ncbi:MULTISPECIES: hypothetical protein [unclassified Bradyrhizobium]|uniref:hypothetical protein n=1 Tax=unclassified Bradyrhizobium TaxID=2631580 RepID=UPI0012EB4DBE|nr:MULTISPECIES: hypothetical protein [unclassified Bradyrhizobium]MCP3465657.1 hypothetical protein [Bradyrhizobium sp. CCGUVB23]